MSDSSIPNAEPRSRAAESTPAPWPDRFRIPAVFLLAALGGCLWGWYLQDDHGAPWLGWFVTVPWLILAVDPRLRGRWRVVMFLVWLHVGAMIGVDFIAPKGLIGWVVAVPFYWVFTVPAFFLMSAIARRWPRAPLALAWPVVFTGVEWFHARYCPGELALPVLAHPQGKLPKLIQIADITGASGLTFVLTSVSGLIGAVYLRKLTHADGAARSLALQAAFVAALVACTLGYGYWQDDESRLVPGPRALVLQTMTPRSAHDATLARHVHELQVLQTLSHAGEDVDMVVWPENSLLIPLYSETRPGKWDPYRLDDLRGLAERMGAPILVGTTLQLAEGGKRNVAVLVASADEPQIYQKVRLLPWAEYLPFADLATSLGQLDAWTAFVAGRVGYVPGGAAAPIEDLNPLRLSTRSGEALQFGAPLCFEASSARVVRQWQRFGVDFLVNQTSEGSLGDSIHERTLTMCQFRSVENRLSTVRCGNDGISALIDSNGRIRERLGGRYSGAATNEAGSLTMTIPLDPTRKGTIYGRFGDWFPIACLVVAVLSALVGGWGSFRARRRAVAAAAPEPESPQDPPSGD